MRKMAITVGLVMVAIFVAGGMALAATITGTDRDETLIGTGYADAIKARGGGDEVRGLGGSDQLYGNGGRDRLVGGYGEDKLYGGNGNDRLRSQDTFPRPEPTRTWSIAGRATTLPPWTSETGFIGTTARSWQWPYRSSPQNYLEVRRDPPGRAAAQSPLACS